MYYIHKDPVRGWTVQDARTGEVFRGGRIKCNAVALKLNLDRNARLREGKTVLHEIRLSKAFTETRHNIHAVNSAAWKKLAKKPTEAYRIKSAYSGTAAMKAAVEGVAMFRKLAEAVSH